MLQGTLLEVWYLVKAVHVELAHERTKVVVLEKAWQDFFAKAHMVRYWSANTNR